MKALFSIALLGALAAGQAYGACTYPTPPDSLPDGATASRDDMLAGKKKVVEFDNAIGAYTSCLKMETEQALAKSPDLTEDQKKEIQKMADQKHNAAVEADEAIAQRFNEQLRAFNAKQAEKKDKK
jgi:hypothetical protein